MKSYQQKKWLHTIHGIIARNLHPINSAHSNSKTEVALLRALQKNFFSKSLCKKEICCGQGDSLFIAIVKKDNECKKAMESCNFFQKYLE